MSNSPSHRLLFYSFHCYLDSSNGAAIATRDLLELLAARGWNCGVLCGPRLDFEQPTALEGVLATHRCRPRWRRTARRRQRRGRKRTARHAP